MSDNATLIERLLNNRAPAIFEAARMAAARIAELEAERDRLRQEIDGLADLWPGAPEMIGTPKGWNDGFVAGLKAFRASIRRTIDEIRARPVP